jgi:hypothetical protein
MHREEQSFSIELNLVAEFDDDYQGDDDGYAWLERFDRELKPRLVRAVFDAIRETPEWTAVAAPRGRDPSRALEIEVRPPLTNAPKKSG